MIPRDCTACGACCLSDRREGDTGYVHLEPEEAQRLERRHPKLPIFQEELGTKVTKDGRVCTALRGRIGRHVECSVYKDRPQLCRSFRKSGGDCRFARRMWGWDNFEA
jgi:Fe-S-cluster containining protein